MGRRNGDGAASVASEFQFELHSPDFDVPSDVQSYIRAKLEAKLGKFAPRITTVIVRMKDINGSKGGPDKSCHMEALVSGLEPVNVYETHEDVRAVIDLAIDRFEDTLRRHIGKNRTKPRQQSRKLARSRKIAQL